MNGETIPSSLRAFIADHIRSVVELESLLLLHKNPACAWNAEELGRELRIDAQWARRQLKHLVDQGLAAPETASPDGYRYAPRMPELDQRVAELAIHYEQRRVSVIELIYAPPPDPLQSFADAFRLRKERPHG